MECRNEVVHISTASRQTTPATIPRKHPKSFLVSLQTLDSSTHATSEILIKDISKSTFKLDPKWTSEMREKLLDKLMHMAKIRNLTILVDKFFPPFKMSAIGGYFLKGGVDVKIPQYPQTFKIFTVPGSRSIIQCGNRTDQRFDTKVSSGARIPRFLSYLTSFAGEQKTLGGPMFNNYSSSSSSNVCRLPAQYSNSSATSQSQGPDNNKRYNGSQKTSLFLPRRIVK
jgi:hypothetical protein